MAEPTSTMSRLQRVQSSPGLRVSPPLPLVEINPARAVREKLRADVEKRRSLKGFNAKANLS